MALAEIHLLTDSTCALPPDIDPAHRARITSLPAILTWGRESYPDGTFDLDWFYDELLRRTDPPATSQPVPQGYLDHYTRAAAVGARVLGIFISRELSGTYPTGAAMAAQVPEADITLFDSGFFSSTLGYMVAEAAALAGDGATVEEIVRRLTWRRARSRLFLTVATLEFLRRSGRATRLQAGFASLLDVKPILSVEEGRLVPVGRVRTRARSLDRLVALAGAHAHSLDAPVWLSVMHGRAPDEAAHLLALLRDRLDVERAFISEAPAVLAVHGGPGVLGVTVTPGSQTP